MPIFQSFSIRTFVSLATLVLLAPTELAHACIGGQLSRSVREYGLGASVRLRVSGGGEVTLENLKFRFKPGAEAWCLVKGDQCDPVTIGTQIQAGGTTVRADRMKLWIGDMDDAHFVEVYPVIVQRAEGAGDVLASVNLHAVDKVSKEHLKERYFDEVTNNVIIGGRDSVTGDINKIGGMSRSLKATEPAVPAIARFSHGCGTMKHLAPTAAPSPAQSHGG